MAKLVMFSEVEGQVVRGGDPVPEVVVERKWHWAYKDRTGVDAVTTDADGRFAFPAVLQSSFLAAWLPMEPVVSQEIHIQADGQDYEAWMFSKHNYDSDGELGRPIRLTCELEREPTTVDDVYGISIIEGSTNN